MNGFAARAGVFAFLVACGTSGDESPPSDPTKPTGENPGNPQGENLGNVPDPKDGNPDAPWMPPAEAGAVSFPYTPYRCGYPIRQVAPSKPAATFHEDVGTAPPKNLHLTVPGNAASSIAIQWSTDDATKASEVRFGESADKLDKVAHGFSFTYGVANRRQHEVHLCGIKPGTTYYYDAGGSKARSAVASFTTAPDAPTEVKVLVVGDTRSDPSVMKAMEPKMLSHGATAMVTTGDAVATGGNQGEWDAFFGAAPKLFAQVAGIYAHGNHEDLDELYFAQNAFADNGGAAGIEEWFSNAYGPVRFVTLNETVSSSAFITGAERAFLETTLKGTDRKRFPWVIANHHMPFYTTSDGHAPNTTTRGAWAPLFDQYHVDVDLSGHVHSYETTLALKGGTKSAEGQVVNDAEGTRYFVFGGGGAPLYGFKAAKPYIAKRESVHGYALMTMSATSFKWDAYRQDGSLIESIAIGK